MSRLRRLMTSWFHFWSWASDLQIKQKVLLGFGSLLALLIPLTALVVIFLSSANSDIAELNGVVHQQSRLLEARIATFQAQDRIKAFVIVSSEDTAKQAERSLREAQGLIADAVNGADRRDQKTQLDATLKSLGSYIKDFNQVVSDQRRIDDLARNKLYVLGPQIQEELHALRQDAYRAGEIRAAFQAAEAAEHYLRTRIAVERYRVESTAETVKAARAEALALEEALNGLYEITQNSRLIGRVDQIIRWLIDYDAAFNALIGTTESRDKRLEHMFSETGPAILAGIGSVANESGKVQSDAASDAKAKLMLILGFTSLVTVAAIVIVVFAQHAFNRLLAEPIVEMAAVMRRLSTGDLGASVASSERRDEIGAMAQSIEVFRANALEVEQLRAEEDRRRREREENERRVREQERQLAHERQAAREQAERERRQLLVRFADDFEKSVRHVVDAVANAAAQIEQASATVTATVASSVDVASTVSSAADETSASATMVAAATEEMSLSLSEVSTRVAESSRIANQAYSRAEQTDDIVTSLARDAQEIGEIISLVQDVAGQVNLLALNAAIEAARAGESGRGFAVVAQEVKNLANQVSEAARRISNQVGSIQRVTGEAVEAIAEIREIMHRTDRLATDVTAVVEQQVATTNEIAANTSQTAMSTQQVAQHILEVRRGIDATGMAAGVASKAASEVARQAVVLQSQVDAFLSRVRSA